MWMCETTHEEKDTHEIQTQLKNAVCKERSEKRNVGKKRKGEFVASWEARRSPWGLVVGGAFVEVGGVCVEWEGLTEGRVVPRIWPERSYSGRVPSAGRPLPVWAPRSLSPGIPRGWRSGSLSAGERPGSVWLRSCSFCAVPSICRPVRRWRERNKRKTSYPFGISAGDKIPLNI